MKKDNLLSRIGRETYKCQKDDSFRRIMKNKDGNFLPVCTYFDVNTQHQPITCLYLGNVETFVHTIRQFTVDVPYYRCMKGYDT